jgi:hypothetical protein
VYCFTSAVRFLILDVSEESMKAIWLFRICSILLLLFGTLHTIGFLKFIPPTAEGQAALAAMNTAHLEKAGTTYTYGMFYRGFGLFVTAYLIFSAYVAWYLANLARNSPAAIGSFAWVFAAFQILTVVNSWVYFPAPPIIFSVAVFVCASAAAVAVRSSTAHHQKQKRVPHPL